MAGNLERTTTAPGDSRTTIADPAKLFAVGRHLLGVGKHREALMALKEVIDADPGEASHQSCYGLALVESGRGRKEGLELCRQAVRQAFYDVALYVNLAKAHLALGDRRRAISVLGKAASMEPGNKLVERTLNEVGRRRRPVFPFLKRGHPLNRLAGRIRHAILGSVSQPSA